ncbi:MAG: repair protein RadC [Bacteroidota bacterium]
MNISIKNWDIQDRPREKLMEKGADVLTDAELLAIILGSGSAKESALDLAKKIIRVIGSLDKLAKASVNDLTKISGIGPAKAISIISVFELGRRRKSDAEIITKISSSNDAYQILKSNLCDLPHEEFWILLLNRANVPVKKIKLSKGGVAGTVVDVKIIVKEAINELASGIIIFHNHPSGNLDPSTADIQITKKIKEALLLVEINLLDHIIITPKSYYSFADEGRL